MSIRCAILFGCAVWIFVLTTFTIMSLIPGIKSSEFLQTMIMAAFIIPFASSGAALYYRNGNQSNGFMVGIVMVSTALLLDIIVTVPMVEIPYNGGNYHAFFTNPVLWFLVLENVMVVYLYWFVRIRQPLSR